ncbi:MAG: hypothetical protein JWM50_1214 [Microbacteriaceae bacterium]|jgi:hypothetical protein|nr:hypothetical protein [Microbacteriaceae bacterium]
MPAGSVFGESRAVEKVGDVHAVPQIAQTLGELDDSRGDPVHRMEQQHLGHTEHRTQTEKGRQ